MVYRMAPFSIKLNVP